MMLVWKEWRQQKWLFLLGCLAGILFPALECYMVWKRSGYFRTDIGSGVILAFGALFAIILAIAATHHETAKRVDSFWQSKPIREWKLFTTKFCLAAALLLIAFLVTISLDLITHFNRSQMVSFAWGAFCYTYPIAVMLFAVTMFLVVIVRDTAKAVLLGIWFALLFYFVPLLLGSLDWMNIFEQMEYSRRKSIVEFIVWSIASRWADSGERLFRSETIPSMVRYMSWPKALWSIVSSPEYVQYLKFLTVTTGTAVGCVILSVLAFKRKWRWRPGQKTIAWTVGLSAAFIFAVSILQAGHNLVPAKTHNNRKIVSRLNLSEQPLHKYDWTDEPLGDGVIHRPRYPYSTTATSVQGDLMFRISTGYEVPGDYGDTDRDTPLHHDFLLNIYQFPYSEEAYHVCETRFFKTELVERDERQHVSGCFLRGDRLYVGYRPTSSRQPSENPIRLLVADVSNPELPRRISDEEISRSDTWHGSVAGHDRYCYVHDGRLLLILSLEQPDKPEIVARLDEYDLGLEDFQHDSWRPQQMSVIEDKLICKEAAWISIFDVTEPTKPRLIYNEGMHEWMPRKEDGQIGGVVYADGTMYVTIDSGLYVLELTADSAGMLSAKLIGRRRATPIEKLAGRRRPTSLVLHKNMLIEAANTFGLLVYDVSDPTRPRRAYHGETLNYTTDVGFWGDLVYMTSYGRWLVLFDIPATK